MSGGIDVEVIGVKRVAGAPGLAEIERLCIVTATQAGVSDGHVAVELVDERRIAQLNEQYRGKQGPTDVLSFPIDGLEDQAGVERELGDVVICPEHTQDIAEAVVHGVLHLLGMDHETDDGEMLALQNEILAAERGADQGAQR